MVILASVVAIIGFLTLLNTFLTVGVIRRLRDHEQRLAEGNPGGDRHAAPPAMIARGETPADFSATTVDGVVVTRDARPAPGLVAFFTTTCGACKEQAPAFVEYLKNTLTEKFDKDRVLIVIGGDGGDQSADFASQFSGLAHLVIESTGSGVAEAYDVSVYPSFAITGKGGVVARSTSKVSDLPVIES